MDRDRPRVLEYLLDESRLDKTELAARVSQALRPHYWTTLCPALKVAAFGAERAVESGSLTEPHRRTLARRLADEGYCELGPLLPQTRIKRMRDAVTSVKNAGWPAVLAFVYDVFWTVWQVPSLANVLAAVIGPDHRMRAHLWCYYVHPVPGARGWPPHADRFGTRGVTVWIPLTDATLENGCIYVIPRDLIPPTIDVGRLFTADTLSMDSFTHLIHCARALPAEAGSVLAWDCDTVHWGGVVRRSTSPRISISAEFVSASESTDDALLSVGAGAMPSFRDRLRVIARSIILFSANDAWTFKFKDLGQMLAEAVDVRHSHGE
jgi:hypothetical protein